MDNYKDFFSLKGKKALICGGAGALGKAIAKALMEHGADICVVDAHPEQGVELEDTAVATGRNYMAFKTDITDETAVNAIAAVVQEQMGRIDILVNAAGINKLKKAEEYDAETWDRVMGVNIKGVHLVTKAVGRFMIEQRYGHILNLSSVKSILGTSQDYIAYCASKGALNMYTKQIACEWAKYGINCNAIAPTFTRTPINSFQLDDPAFYNALVARIPIGRICALQDVAAAAVYLCSDAASFVNGHILVIDGGLTVTQ